MISRIIEKFSFDREPILTILLCYFIPVFFYTHWSTYRLNSGWAVWSMGLALALFGTAVLYLVMQSQVAVAKQLQATDTTALVEPKKVTPISLDSLEQAPFETAHEEEGLYHAQIIMELKDSHNQMRQTEQELRTAQKLLRDAEEEIEQLAVEGFKNTESVANEQANLHKLLAKKQEKVEAQEQHIQKLKKKNADLNYELKTLLQLGEMEANPGRIQNFFSGPQPLHPALDSLEQESLISSNALNLTTPTSTSKCIRSDYDASTHLEQCIALAEGMESAAHLTNGSKFSDLAANSSQALDLRRLTDAFRTEISVPILFVNPVDGVPLFASNQVQGLLGWMPEKLTKDFYRLLQEGLLEWQNALQDASSKGNTTVRLILRAKSGEDLMLYAHLGVVCSSVFTNYVIAVLYPPLSNGHE